MSWLAEPIAYLDTETTGPDPESDRIVTIHIGRADGPGEPPQVVLDLLVNPGIRIPAEATEVHGITDAAAAGGVATSAAAVEIRDALMDLVSQHLPVVGHNLPFDLTLIDRELRRNGESGIPQGLRFLDTLVLFRRLDLTTGGRRLEDLAERNGITFPAHNAEADAFASLRLLHVLAGRDDLLEHVGIDALQGLQAKWYADQQENARYKRIANGQDASGFRTDWPIRPYRQEAA